MIELENVSYAYEGRPALSGVGFRVERGESVCLLGRNGSGKSTLLRLLCGLIFPSSGTYRFDGTEITRQRMKDAAFSKRFHQRVGFVFQDSEAQLFCSNVYDEVAFGPRQMGLDEEAAAKRTEDCLALLKLEDFRDRQPYHLSGGEKKKVAIAAALALNPEVLVLDEPMNGLDPRTERWLAAFLVSLNRAGKTILTSTHNLELVQEISRRAVLFDEAHRVAADAPTETLLEDAALLRSVNLVDEFYHVHEDHGREHFHIHTF